MLVINSAKFVKIMVFKVTILDFKVKIGQIFVVIWMDFKFKISLYVKIRPKSVRILVIRGQNCLKYWLLCQNCPVFR